MNNFIATDKCKTGFNVESYERLARVEANNFWFCARNRLIIWALRRYFPKVKNFLEIGCGTGFVLSEIEKNMDYDCIMGSDMHGEGLICGSRRLKKARLFQMDIQDLALKDKLDLVGAFDVLEHINKDEEALNKIYSALNRGGGIIITVPCHKFLWSYADELSFHVRRYSTNEIKKKINKAGFMVRDTIPFVSFLLPLVLMRRLMKKPKQKNDNVILDLRLPRGINWLLERILSFEIFLIRIGMRINFGASILVVAYKD